MARASIWNVVNTSEHTGHSEIYAPAKVFLCSNGGMMALRGGPSEY